MNGTLLKSDSLDEDLIPVRPAVARERSTSAVHDREPFPILFLDNSFTFGGAILSLEVLVHGLRQEAYAPILLTAQPEEDMQELFPEIKVQHRRMPQPWVDDRWYRHIRKWGMMRIGAVSRAVRAGRFLYWMVAHTLTEAVAYARFARQQGVRLIHLNNNLESQLAGILAARILGIPCVAHARSFQQVDRVTRLYARMVSHHIAISTAIRDNLIDMGVSPADISIIQDDVDLTPYNALQGRAALFDDIGIPRDAPVFGIFGRIVRWKGVKEFVDACRHVLARHPDAYALIVGDRSDGEEEYQAEVSELISRSGLDGRVVMTGYQKNIAELMASMEVVVHASIEPEPFGRVVIEAMAARRPIVATAAGGPIDIVKDGETGLLVPPGDVTAMGHAISRLLDDPFLAAEMGERGRARVERYYSAGSVARQLEPIYEMLIGGDGRND